MIGFAFGFLEIMASTGGVIRAFCYHLCLSPLLLYFVSSSAVFQLLAILRFTPIHTTPISPSCPRPAPQEDMTSGTVASILQLLGDAKGTSKHASSCCLAELTLESASSRFHVLWETRMILPQFSFPPKQMVSQWVKQSPIPHFFFLLFFPLFCLLQSYQY